MQTHAQVACYIDGILTVHLDNSVWANQFRYLKLDFTVVNCKSYSKIDVLKPLILSSVLYEKFIVFYT